MVQIQVLKIIKYLVALKLIKITLLLQFMLTMLIINASVFLNIVWFLG